MVAKALIPLALILPLGFCSTTSGTGLCTLGPFITDPGATERLTRSEKEYQVALNSAGSDICGWKPPRG